MIKPKKHQFKQGVKIICLSLLLIFSGYKTYAQPANDNCSSAQTLCSNEILQGTTVDATTGVSSCFSSNAMVWYIFTTNGDRSGSVIVNVTRDSLCSIPGTTGDGLQGVVLLSTDPFGDPCIDPSLFLEASNCASGENELVLTLLAALPNTQYWVQIDGLINDQGIPTACGFDISISGHPVEVFAGSDNSIFNGASDTLDGAGPDPGTFFWNNPISLSDANTLTPIAEPDITTTYTLTGDIGECKNLTDAVTITIKDEGVVPRNLIIPNSDIDKNRIWYIGSITDFPNAVVEVYNRWGQRVFISIGYDNLNGWDGTRNGTPLPEGTYYYVIQLNRSDLNVANVQTGFVAIVR